MEQRTCLVCDEPFDRSFGAGGTCSTRCMMWAKKHPGNKPPKVKTCPTCLADFSVSHRAMKYCSSQCRAAASKRRCRDGMKPYVRFAACVTCDGPMPADAKAGRQYCSLQCGLRNRDAERAFVADLDERSCQHCGTWFQPRNRRNVTCSRRCSRLLHYYANREEYSARAQRWMADNPERWLEVCRAWRVENADALRERGLVWTRANPDRVAVAGQRRRAAKRDNRDSVGVNIRDWQRALNRAAGCCYYCGASAPVLHMEHVIPLSRDGRHAIGNVVPACPMCNLTKRDKLLTEWRYGRKAGRRKSKRGDAQWSQDEEERTLSA